MITKVQQMVSAVALAALAQTAWAQHTSGYASLTKREIKALSSEQVRDLREGRGMALSLPAELNSTPGPLHVLEMRALLGVSAAQAEQLEQVASRMRAHAVNLGNAIIGLERELDVGFKGGELSDARIDALTQRLGTLNGQLRAIHLTAHLRTKNVLSTAQIAAYDRERGYVGSGFDRTGDSAHQHAR